MDSFFRRELWKPHQTEDIHNVSIVEIAYISLVGIMIFVDGFNVVVTWKAMRGGHFRRRSIMSKEFKAYLNNKKPRKKKRKQEDGEDGEKLEQQEHQSSLKKNNRNCKKRPAAKVSFREEEIEIEDEDVKLV